MGRDQSVRDETVGAASRGPAELANGIDQARGSQYEFHTREGRKVLEGRDRDRKSAALASRALRAGDRCAECASEHTAMVRDAGRAQAADQRCATV